MYVYPFILTSENVEWLISDPDGCSQILRIQTVKMLKPLFCEKGEGERGLRTILLLADHMALSSTGDTSRPMSSIQKSLPMNRYGLRTPRCVWVHRLGPRDVETCRIESVYPARNIRPVREPADFLAHCTVRGAPVPPCSPLAVTRAIWSARASGAFLEGAAALGIRCEASRGRAALLYLEG